MLNKNLRGTKRTATIEPEGADGPDPDEGEAEDPDEGDAEDPDDGGAEDPDGAELDDPDGAAEAGDSEVTLFGVVVDELDTTPGPEGLRPGLAA